MTFNTVIFIKKSISRSQNKAEHLADSVARKKREAKSQDDQEKHKKRKTGMRNTNMKSLIPITSAWQENKAEATYIQ